MKAINSSASRSFEGGCRRNSSSGGNGRLGLPPSSGLVGRAIAGSENNPMTDEGKKKLTDTDFGKPFSFSSIVDFF